jgi:sterol desaturase/sphingolipid hydroxylase (fatty acid hydroxylase superfamily)
MPPNFSPVDLAIPGFILLIILEMLWARKNAPEKYEARDTLTSLALGTGSTVAGALTGGVVSVAALWLYDHRLFDIGWVWWAWPLCFILDDLGYYWFHRSAHRVRWFWAGHVNHHSSQHYNLSTALRQSWTSFFALSFIFRIPLALIGFHPAMILFCGAINLIYQFWIHTEAIGKLPRWFEYVMNTPSHHRVHHATNPRYLDANYAGSFIIWDRMFGTFTEEVEGERIRYGIVKQLGSFNLIWAVFHEWIGIARDLWSAPWGTKLGYIWRPPGWSHDGSRDTSDSIKARWQEQQGGGTTSNQGAEILPQP